MANITLFKLFYMATETNPEKEILADLSSREG